MKHYITKYTEGKDLIVESWLQINFLNRAYCFSKKRIRFIDALGNYKGAKYEHD